VHLKTNEQEMNLYVLSWKHVIIKKIKKKKNHALSIIDGIAA